MLQRYWQKFEIISFLRRGEGGFGWIEGLFSFFIAKLLLKILINAFIAPSKVVKIVVRCGYYPDHAWSLAWSELL